MKNEKQIRDLVGALLEETQITEDELIKVVLRVFKVNKSKLSKIIDEMTD